MRKLTFFLALAVGLACSANLSKTYNYELSKLVIENQKEDGQPCVDIRYPGLYSSLKEGAPEVPMAYHVFAVPASATDIKVDIVRSNGQKVNLSAPARKVILETLDGSVAQALFETEKKITESGYIDGIEFLGNGMKVVACDDFESYHMPESGNGLDCLNNDAVPGWSFSVSCNVMPYDYIYEDLKPFDGKYTFGESYLLGKNYGGIGFIGNTRTSFCVSGQATHKKIFEDIIKIRDTTDSPRCAIGNVFNVLRGTGPSYFHDKLSYNLLGDPMANIWLDTPKKLKHTVYNNEYAAYAWDMHTKLYIARSPISAPDETQYYEMGEPELTGTPINTNEMCTVYGKGLVPVIMPVYIQNTTISGDTPSHVIGRNIYAGENVHGKAVKGLVNIKNGTEITFEALENVNLGKGLILESASQVNVQAATEASVNDIELVAGNVLTICAPQIQLNNLTVKAGATLIAEGQVAGIEEVNIAKGAKVIINGELIAGKNAMSQNQYLPLVKEGRTWWYDIVSTTTRGNEPAVIDSECGITIGETQVIDGVEWHKVMLTHAYDFCTTQSTAQSPEPVVYHLPQTISYIREDVANGKVYARFSDDTTFDYNPVDDLQHKFFPFNEGDNEILLYDFGQPGDQIYLGNDSIKETFAITEVQPAELYGIQTVKYTATPHGPAGTADSPTPFWSHPVFTYAQGIGYVSAEDKDANSEFFFYPVSTLTTSMFRTEPPVLRYITEGDTHEILCQAAGGRRLWQGLEGVDNIIADDADACAEYYTLQGVRVSTPATPGIYVVKKGCKVTKQTIR